MGTKKPERTALVKATLKKYPDVPTKTLARKLYNENPEWFPSIESARTSIRYFRGNRGHLSRTQLKDKSMVRPNGKAGYKATLPKSQANDWIPLQIDGPAKVLSLSDIHVPYHDTKALRAAIRYGKKLKPNVLLLNGDIADFFTISRWLKNPKQRKLQLEIEAQQQLLDHLAEQFPRARCIYKVGNHEERWDHFIWTKAPELWDLPQMRLDTILELEDRGYEYVTDQRPVAAGRLPILHGHELGKSVFNPVNQSRGAYLRTAHSVLVGHGHRSSTHAEPNMWHEEITCWSQGCLCGLSPDYARVNKWNHGFAFVEVYRNNEFSVTNYRISDGKVRQS